MAKLKQYADHPRYGRFPRITGLNPDPLDRKVSLHWNATNHYEICQRFETQTGKKWPYGDWGVYARDLKRIPDTAIVANLARQTPATVPVTHYFDLERKCSDCGKPFIFFAEEQKHWYEELGFGLESDCIRCVPCRKRQQGIAWNRERYEELFHLADRTTEENLEMADCCLSLIEASVFHIRQIERVRMLLNRIPLDRSQNAEMQYAQLLARVLALESGEEKNRDSSKAR